MPGPGKRTQVFTSPITKPPESKESGSIVNKNRQCSAYTKGMYVFYTAVGTRTSHFYHSSHKDGLRYAVIFPYPSEMFRLLCLIKGRIVRNEDGHACTPRIDSLATKSANRQGTVAIVLVHASVGIWWYISSRDLHTCKNAFLWILQP